MILEDLDEALALATDEGIRVQTPESARRFRLYVTGDDSWQITGHGLDAWLPREGRPGDQVTVDVLSRPTLFQTTAEGGVTDLRARGKLSYRENSADGRTSVVLEDTVEISMSGDSRVKRTSA